MTDDERNQLDAIWRAIQRIERDTRKIESSLSAFRMWTIIIFVLVVCIAIQTSK